MKFKTIWLLPIMLLGVTACQTETQNQLRRQVVDIAGGQQYISIYSRDGKAIFDGKVNGKVSRADNAEGAVGEYVYWFDEKGRYAQTNMPYLVTSYDRNAPKPQ